MPHDESGDEQQEEPLLPALTSQRRQVHEGVQAQRHLASYVGLSDPTTAEGSAGRLLEAARRGAAVYHSREREVLLAEPITPVKPDPLPQNYLQRRVPSMPRLRIAPRGKVDTMSQVGNSDGTVEIDQHQKAPAALSFPTSARMAALGLVYAGIGGGISNRREGSGKNPNLRNDCLDILQQLMILSCGLTEGRSIVVQSVVRTGQKQHDVGLRRAQPRCHVGIDITDREAGVSLVVLVAQRLRTICQGTHKVDLKTVGNQILPRA